jgi:dTDP-glucose pyrophosphorylase
MNIVILMAGTNKDFEERGYFYPNYLLEIQNKPLIQLIIESIESFTDSRIIFIMRKEDNIKYALGDVVHVLAPQGEIITIEGSTKGAVCTALFAIDDINTNEELLVVNGDQLIKGSIGLAVDNFRGRNLDGGIITFKSVHPRWSFVAIDTDGMVIQTSEKRPISDIATAGCYYYKDGRDFISACFGVIEKDIQAQGRYFISSTYNEMILRQKSIGIYEIMFENYISFANYQMYENYITRKEDYDD